MCFLRHGNNIRKPNELMISLMMFGWVVGNGFWTVFDFADDRESYLGMDLSSPEWQAFLVNAAGVCFGGTFGVGVMYFLYLRYGAERGVPAGGWVGWVIRSLIEHTTCVCCTCLSISALLTRELKVES